MKGACLRQRRRARRNTGVAIVDRVRSPMYDPSYPVTAHAPRGHASHLRSPASISTRANPRRRARAQARGGLGSVHDPSARANSFHEDPFGRARPAPRSTCRSEGDQRSRPAERAQIDRLRPAAPSRWRPPDAAGPAIVPERDRLGDGADAAACGSARIGRGSRSPFRRAHALGGWPRAVLGDSPRRSAASATALAPVFLIPQIFPRRLGPVGVRAGTASS